MSVDKTKDSESTIHALVDRAVESFDMDSDAWHDLMYKIKRVPSEELLQQAFDLCETDESARQIVGLEILGQLSADPMDPSPYKDRSAPVVAKMLHSDNSDVVYAAVRSLGFLAPDDYLAELAMIGRLSCDEGVRLAVVQAINRSTSPEAVDALAQLASDPDPSVREWALFSLAVSDTNSEGTTAILRSALSDEHSGVRAEAIRGLAKRGIADVDALIEQEVVDGNLHLGIVRALIERPNPSLLSCLESAVVEDDALAEALEIAIAECHGNDLTA